MVARVGWPEDVVHEMEARGFSWSGEVGVSDLPQPKALLLTRHQAAMVLTVSVRKLDRLVASGDLMATRIGGSVRFAPAQLEAFVEQNTDARVPWPTAAGRHNNSRRH